MKQISSLDLYFLTKEFKELLENSRIETFYQEEDVFYLKIYVKGKGHFFLTNKVSKYIYISDVKLDNSTIPKSFIQYLRKFLKNGFIQKIKQIENERILDIEISKKNQNNDKFEIFHLIIELFANGNIILCASNFNIKNSLQKKKFKDRTVMVKDIYQLPPQKNISIYNLDKDKLKKELKESDLSIVKFLAIKLGIGGKFAEEIIYNCNINKNKLTVEIKSDEVEKIKEESINIINSNIKASAILNEKGEIIDFEPIYLNSITNKRKEYNSFNELLKDYFNQFRNEKDKKEVEYLKELKKLENRVKKQELKKKDILLNYEVYNNYGNKIYENYALIEDLLESINKSAKEKGWDYVKNKIKENPELSKIIKTIKPNKNEIILNLD